MNVIFILSITENIIINDDNSISYRNGIVFSDIISIKKYFNK
jgi:hypothetical protein